MTDELCIVEMNPQINQKAMENAMELKGDWNETKKILKQKFAYLTDDGALFESSPQTELLNRVQAKLGKTKQEIQFIIS